MSDLLVNEQDQKFVLFDMLNVDELCNTPQYNHFSPLVFVMTLKAALELAEKESLPTITEADMEGCGLINGQVSSPKCFQRLIRLYKEGDWPSVGYLRENGGQGFPMSIWLATSEGFMSNGSFLWLVNRPYFGTTIIEKFGSDVQKKKYLKKCISGEWGTGMAFTEDNYGSDTSMQTVIALKQHDGTYHINGIKGPVTGGDTDLYDNIIHVVLARIEGDPLDKLSLFLVPKYIVNSNGTLGKRNDYRIVELQDKMGFRGTPTCRISFGDNNECFAEIMGDPGKAMVMIMKHKLFHEMNLSCGMQATASASAAYLHSLKYARQRHQGTSLENFNDANAPRVPIIKHPDVRRMLLYMKSNVEGMRALMYFAGMCFDKSSALTDSKEKSTYLALRDMLIPFCKVFNTEKAFRVIETAIQVHGRYGYYKDYPVEQLLRDVKVQSIWEITSGLVSLQFIAETIGQNGGRDFVTLLDYMNKKIESYQSIETIKDLSQDIQSGIDLLTSTSSFSKECFEKGKFIVPISNAVPFMQLMGTVIIGWLLYWQAGLSSQKLDGMTQQKAVNSDGTKNENRNRSNEKQAAFLKGKIDSARYYIKNILPNAYALEKAIKNEDLSLMTIDDESF